MFPVFFVEIILRIISTIKKKNNLVMLGRRMEFSSPNFTVHIGTVGTVPMSVIQSNKKHVTH